MDTDAMHLRLDELHGELRSGYEVHFVLPYRKERNIQLHDSLCHWEPMAALCPPAIWLTTLSISLSQFSSFTAGHISVYCPFFLGTNPKEFMSCTYL